MYMYIYRAMTVHIYTRIHIGETMAGGEDFLARRSRAKEDTSFPDEVRLVKASYASSLRPHTLVA